jgi:hypothetical protein
MVEVIINNVCQAREEESMANPTHDSQPRPKNRGGWRRSVRRAAVVLMVLCLIGVTAFVILAKDHIRSLWSFRRVPDTNMYVMDYYGTYI